MDRIEELILVETSYPFRKHHMRSVMIASLLIAAAGSFAETATADPYRWCAQYSGGGHGGGTNCYFITLRQCQETVFGVGGYCVPNNFYDGRPVTTPGERINRGRNRAAR
jgi:Protein of unknown function (DUF3551)